jgi:hypothetical protein
LRGGVAFFYPSRPDFQYALLGLGEVPNTAYFMAAVKHSQEHFQGGVRKGYVLGCEFIRRVELGRAPPPILSAPRRPAASANPRRRR